MSHVNQLPITHVCSCTLTTATPQSMLLYNGAKREDLELDSEIDKTAFDFPADLTLDDLMTLKTAVHFELKKFYKVSAFPLLKVHGACAFPSSCPFTSAPRDFRLTFLRFPPPPSSFLSPSLLSFQQITRHTGHGVREKPGMCHSITRCKTLQHQHRRTGSRCLPSLPSCFSLPPSFSLPPLLPTNDPPHCAWGWLTTLVNAGQLAPHVPRQNAQGLHGGL